MYNHTEDNICIHVSYFQGNIIRHYVRFDCSNNLHVCGIVLQLSHWHLLKHHLTSRMERHIPEVNIIHMAGKIIELTTERMETRKKRARTASSIWSAIEEIQPFLRDLDSENEDDRLSSPVLFETKIPSVLM